MEIKPIAFIKNRYTDKFGIPRQPDKVSNISEIVFEPEYRNEDALREIEGFSHLWLIFDFSLSHRDEFVPVVRPPRLGGNKKVGVFASRSPYRPNSLGLSVVRLSGIEKTADRGTVLRVTGADLLNGTPIYDIKPYIPYCDSVPDAKEGYTATNTDYRLKVEFCCDVSGLSDDFIKEIEEILSEDPRPQYKKGDEKVYRMHYGDLDISFKVEGNTAKVIKTDEYKE